MNANRNLLVAAPAFAAGVAAGLLFAPRSGDQTRRLIGRQFLAPTRWVEDRLHDVERQLAALENQLAATTSEFGEKLHEVTSKAVGQYVPSVPDDPASWENVDGNELTKDLRRMPR
jgi:gas vesicle protein